MTNSPKDYIQGAIDKIELRVKNGRLKPLRVKAKTEATKNEPEDVSKTLNDTVSPVKRKIINRKVRADHNPLKGAHNPVSDLKKKISDEIRKDLENF